MTLFLTARRRAVVALSCLVLIGAVMAVGAPVVHGDGVVIYKVYVTDVRDSSFTVSWITDVSADGRADWGAVAPLPNSAVDPVNSSTAHRVVIPEVGALAASTEYQAQVHSADVIENNAGENYRLITGPTLFPPSPGNTVWGYVYKAGGVTPAADAVVFLRLHDTNESGSANKSQWVTARADAGGVWYYGLNNVRTADAAGYFMFDPGYDELEIIARGGAAGAAGTDVLIPSNFPGGAAQLANVVLADPPGASAPDVEVALNGEDDVRLSWPHTAENVDYEVWQSDEPYFIPRNAGTHRLAELHRPDSVGSLYFDDEGAAGAPASCGFYVVLAYDLGGKPADTSNRVGRFAFALTPGG